MRESAQAALSLVKTQAESLGIDPALFEKSDIHVHVPAGATPKDGPSAGVAMFTALVSLLTAHGAQRYRHDRRDSAARPRAACRRHQGEGGRRCCRGLERVLLPARNRRDYDDIPQAARDRLEFVWLERVDEAIAAALEAKAEAAPAGEDVVR